VVITPGISDDSETIAREDIGAVLRELTPQGYQEALHVMDRLLQGQPRAVLARRIRGVAERLRSFGRAEAVYKSVYSARLGS
jgi:hypothetical protein